MKKIALILMLCLLASMTALKAQTTITIGEGSTTRTNYFPVNTYSSQRYSVSQMIYVENQLTAVKGCAITDIAFFTHPDYNMVQNTRQWRVYIKSTDKTSFSSTSKNDWVIMEDSDLYFGSKSGGSDVTIPYGGEVSIKLKESFQYNGGNIVICVCEDGGTTGTATFRSLSVSESRSLGRRDNSSTYDPKSSSSLGTGTNCYAVVPVLKLTFAAVAKFDLNVNVTDGTNPLENATVTITGANSNGNLNLAGSTNASGQYVSSDLLHPSTCYTVTVAKSGYKTVTEQVCAQNIQNDSYTLNVTMEEAPKGPASLRTNKDVYSENEPVIFSWDNVASPDVRYYRLYRYLLDEWQLVVTTDGAVQYECATGYTYGQHEFCVTAVYSNGTESEKGEAVVEISVVAEGSVLGNVRSEGGMPIEGAKVIAEYAITGMNISYETTTKEDGSFAIEGIMTGFYKITVSKVGYYDKVLTDIEIKKNETNNVGYVFLTAWPYWDCDVTATLRDNGTGVYSDDYVEVTWSGAEADIYDRYNIYRKNVETGEIELISHYTIANKYYKDNEWNLLDDGIYQYGVSAYTGNIIEVLNEDFNKNGVIPEGWTLLAPYGSEWFMSNSEKGTGSINYAYDDDDPIYMKDPTLYWAGSAGLNGKNYFITPKLNVKDALLSFYYATPFPSEDTTSALNVCWSTSPTGPWTSVWDAPFTYFSWLNTEQDLMDLPEKYVYLAFCANIPDQFAVDGSGKYYRAAVDAVLVQSREETQIVWSNEIEKNTYIIFHNDTGNNDWHTAGNWSTGKVPTADDNAKIIADAIVFSGDAATANINITKTGSLTVNAGATYKATGAVRVYDNNPAKFVINDGAQVYQNNANILATFNMNIANPGSWGPDGTDHKGGWQFIASPFVDADLLSYVNPTTGDYDLYKYDGKVDTLEWRNYKLHHDELFCNFSIDRENWISRDDNRDGLTWEHAVFRKGCDDKFGCMSLTTSVTSNDYLVSPRKLNIYPESKLRFYVKLHSNDILSSVFVLDEGLEVVYSKDETFSGAFSLIANVESYSSSGWTEVLVDLSDIASTTDDVDAEEAWIAIRFNLDALGAIDNLLIDDIELVNVYNKATPFEKTFLQGRGYMASYESATTVSMTGTLYHGNSFVYDLDYNADDRWENFYLLGNPFPYDVTWGEFARSGIVDGFAVVNSTTGAYQYYVDDNNTINAGDGFMVLTTASNPSLSVNATRGTNNRRTDYVNVVAHGVAGSDNLIINLAGKEKTGFFKLQNFNKDIASVYVTDYDDMYGIANYDEDVEEVDFCFVANNIGYYTINMIPSGDFTSLKLYDRVENVEVDMLQEKEYKFFALSEDYANENRFVLKYEKKGVESNETFAYQSGDDIVVNAEGLIQIIDVMGRIIYSEETQGVNNRINVNGMENATYILRNIKNNEVRTQKIVIL